MILNIIVLVLAIPAGILIRHLASDELVQGRKWIRTLTIISIVGAILSYGFGFYAAAWTFAFMFIVAAISLK